MKRRKFTREFKLSVLNELDNGKPGAQICREHNLSPSCLYKWRRDYNANPRKAFSGSGNLWKEEAKIIQYERLIGQLYAEITLLKKTIESLQKRRAEERLLK